MDFNNDNSDKKKKIVTLVAVLLILCIVIAVIIFLILNNDLWNNKDTPSNTPSGTYSDNSLVPTDSSESLPTNTARIPKEINIRYENDVLIFDGLSKECEFTTLFDSSKDYIFSEYRNPGDTKPTSWYEIDNKSVIYFTILLDQYNTYQFDENSIFPDNSLVQKVEIKKNVENMSLDIKLITDRCIAVSDISTTQDSASYSLSEVKNMDFYNYSNVYSRKFFFIPEYQLCKQSDSTVIYYEDNIDDGQNDVYSIRFKANAWSSLKGRNINYELDEEKIYINDGYIEYIEFIKEEIGGVLYYRMSFLFQKELILYPNANSLFSTLTLCDPNIENLIFIDAGHGGHDPGTESRTDDKFNEADINLGICLKVEQLLLEKGYNVYMTRNEDIYLGFALERGDIANLHNAKLFLSVHVDSYTEESAKGILSIWRDDQDKPFAQVIQKNIVRTSFASDRGLMWQSLAVHGRTECPAVTIESGFITNPTESAKLKTDEYQQRIAQGIADGIIEYINIIDNNE